MTRECRMALLGCLVGLLALGMAGAAGAAGKLGPGMGVANKATGGGLEAAAIGELGDTQHGPPVERLLDLPALKVDRDAEGRIIMDLPGLKLVGPSKKAPAAPAGPRARKLPVTGVNVGDLLAAGLGALGAGGLFVRRVRFALGG